MNKVSLISLLGPVLLAGAELKDVRSVYLYPMAGGLDQYLANRLAKDHVFRVVTDPKLADAVFTDQLGRSFEYRLDRIKRDALSAAPGAPVAGIAVPSGGNPDGRTDTEPPVNTFSRGKGTVFLVEAKSRQVVWSDYRKPKSTASRDLDRAAKELAMKLAQTLNPPVESAK